MLAELGYAVTAFGSFSWDARTATTKGSPRRPGGQHHRGRCHLAAARDSFDAVVERHLLWTLPRPDLALDAWHKAAPDGRLVLLESQWGNADGLPHVLRRRARAALHRLQHRPERTPCRVRRSPPRFAPPGSRCHAGASHHLGVGQLRGASPEFNDLRTSNGRPVRAWPFSTGCSACNLDLPSRPAGDLLLRVTIRAGTGREGRPRRRVRGAFGVREVFGASAGRALAQARANRRGSTAKP